MVVFDTSILLLLLHPDAKPPIDPATKMAVEKAAERITHLVDVLSNAKEKIIIPTSCSWLNAVEGFFAKLTRRRLKRGVFHSVVDLQAAINRFVKEHNREPKPFIWRADPYEIIAAVRRGHQTLESIH